MSRGLLPRCVLLTLVAAAAQAAPPLNEAALTAIEERIGGRVGVALVGGDGTVLNEYRGDERFAMCSTFKLALAAAILEEVAAGRMSLDDVVLFEEADLLEYAPVAREHVAAGRMTVGELAEAISTLSDNTAANLLLARIGGPAALTAFFRRHGDAISRLDRTEPELNENAPGDERDTTTPRAMAGLVRRLVLGEALGDAARQQLAAWAVANQTGDDRIRAGIPGGWRVGDKTGSCGTAYNDVAIVWPPEAEPFVLAVYIDRPTAEAEQVEAAIAEIGGLAANLATAPAPNPAQIRSGMLVWRIGVNSEEGPSAMVETITRATYEGRPTWRVTHYDQDPASAEVNGFDLYDLDRETLAPIRSVMHNGAFELELMFTPREVTLRRVAEDGGKSEERVALKTAVQGEGPGLRVLVASLPLRPGFEFRYHQVDRWGGEGESRVKPMTLSVLRRTRVQTAFGARDALEVVIEPDDRSFRIRSQVRARPPFYPYKVEYVRGEMTLVSEVTTMAFEGGGD